MNMDVSDFIRAANDRTIVGLGLELHNSIPNGHPHAPFTYSLMKQHGDLTYRGGVSAANDVMSLGLHVATHIDALGHISKDGQVFGGLSIDEIRGDPRGDGLRQLGVDSYAPFVQRGVLLDIARYQGVEEVDPERGIDGELLSATSEALGVSVQPGDAVLVRTGWEHRWPDPQRYQESPAPGVDLDGINWLIAQGTTVVGSDTYGFEQMPAKGMPVHVACLVDHGVPIIEALALTELAELKPKEFLFMASPLKIRGATGSPIRPVALV